MRVRADQRRLLVGRRVVVTGIGAVSPVGLTAAATWECLLAGQSGAGTITRFDPEGFETQIACEVKDFDPGNYLDRKEARRMDRYTHLGVAASREAIADAQLSTGAGCAEEIGVVVGTGVGGIETLCQQYRVMLERGPSRVSPFLTTMMAANMAAGHISICLGLTGPTYGMVSACASGAHALGEAFETIRRGRVSIMLAGGAEAPVVPLALGTFNSMRALSVRNDAPTKASRPFDAERDGFVLGEGAGMLVLEAAEHAEARGARIYGELAGYGATSDAFHITAPAEGGAGASRAMALALDEAGLGVDDVDYINAHGTSTMLNDRAESQAIKQLFGERAYQILISSTKSMTGHLLGAAGAVEAIVCVLAMRDGMVPPTINQEFPDPECDLDFVANVKRRACVRVALSNSLGFGGHNATLVFRSWEG
jgi:3-oxoacyl-[acyl-carrier-protein] synthase II